MSKRTNGIQDLVVFLAVLAAGTFLVLRGVAPELLVAFVVLVTGLYTAWRSSGNTPPSSR
ncbi:hypothetical protein ACFC0N_27040 [Streptomyces zaomyceticus]|uniref:hypothetical protein n=1 Tax=Streptomyces zaomyceticus TaxID=68286 RepID=UPI0035E1754A